MNRVRTTRKPVGSGSLGRPSLDYSPPVGQLRSSPYVNAANQSQGQLASSGQSITPVESSGVPLHRPESNYSQNSEEFFDTQQHPSTATQLPAQSEYDQYAQYAQMYPQYAQYAQYMTYTPEQYAAFDQYADQYAATGQYTATGQYATTGQYPATDQYTAASQYAPPNQYTPEQYAQYNQYVQYQQLQQQQQQQQEQPQKQETQPQQQPQQQHQELHQQELQQEKEQEKSPSSIAQPLFRHYNYADDVVSSTDSSSYQHASVSSGSMSATTSARAPHSNPSASVSMVSVTSTQSPRSTTPIPVYPQSSTRVAMETRSESGSPVSISTHQSMRSTASPSSKPLPPPPPPKPVHPHNGTAYTTNDARPRPVQRQASTVSARSMWSVRSVAAHAAQASSSSHSQSPTSPITSTRTNSIRTTRSLSEQQEQQDHERKEDEALGIGTGSSYVQHLRTSATETHIAKMPAFLPLGLQRTAISTHAVSVKPEFLRRAMDIRYKQLPRRMLETEVDDDEQPQEELPLAGPPSAYSNAPSTPVLDQSDEPRRPSSPTDSIIEQTRKIKLFVANPDSD